MTKIQTAARTFLAAERAERCAERHYNRAAIDGLSVTDARWAAWNDAIVTLARVRGEFCGMVGADASDAHRLAVLYTAG